MYGIFRRVTLIILDSLGVGALPDASEYGDEGANTLGHIIENVPDIDIPNLTKLGFLNTLPYNYGNGDSLRERFVAGSAGSYARLAEASGGKDTTTGHWEIAGLKVDPPFRTFENFPSDFIDAFERAIGTEVIGNYPASGTEIIEKLGDEHEATGKPIVYTSADSVFQIAANTAVIPLERLYEICATARAMLTGPLLVGRVIARPYIKKDGKRIRTADRHDYSVTPPHGTVLDRVKESGGDVVAIGKISDIFAGQGVTESYHNESNDNGCEHTIRALGRDSRGLIFTNLVDFDSQYGHRRDIPGYARAIERFDAFLPRIITAMRDDDVLMISADHGTDPAFKGTDHTREYIPLVCYGKRIKGGVDLGTRSSYADIGRSITQALGTDPTPFGEEFISGITV
jgi:phosphopentomutase